MNYQDFKRHQFVAHTFDLQFFMIKSWYFNSFDRFDFTIFWQNLKYGSF
jgi:hypothetical protein